MNMYHYCIFTCISQDQISVNTSLPPVWHWGPTNWIRFREETGAMSRFFRMGVVVFVDFFFLSFSSISWIFLKIFFLILLRFEVFSTYVSCLRNQLGCAEAIWELASRFRRGEEFLPFLLLWTVANLKQNEAQSAYAEPTLKGYRLGEEFLPLLWTVANLKQNEAESTHKGAN